MTRVYFCDEKNYFSIDDEHCPTFHDKVAHFTQIVLNGHCEIPPPKPDSKKLISYHHSITITSAEAIPSVEFINGCQLEGKKVIVAGIFKLGIEYSDKCPDQKVHFFECNIPFQTILLKCFNGEQHLFPPSFCLNDFKVHVCVEELKVNRISERCFEKVIVLMIWLKPLRN